MNITEALPTFLITLREGFEAALVVGIVLACLQKAGKNNLNIWVYYGIIAGIIASVGVELLLTNLWAVFDNSPTPLAPVIQPLLKAGFCAIAIVMLSWMLIWMTQQAKSLKSEVEGTINSTLQQENIKAVGVGIFTIIFIAVLREGIEISLFLVATITNGLMPILGAIAGLLVSALMGTLLFKWGVKINIRRFFQIMGIFLLIIVAGLVISTLKNLDLALSTLALIKPEYAPICFAAPSSCILGELIWDTRAFLPDTQFPGTFLKVLFGYRDQIYLLQVVAYLAFLLVIGGFYFLSLAEKLNYKIILKKET